MSTWMVPDRAGAQALAGYTERRELGRGSSGRVIEAVDDASGRRVAVKFLSADLARDPEFMRRLRAEAARLRELAVPQVVQVYDLVEQGQASVVMELADGVSLHEMIQRRGPLGPRAALAVLKNALLALAAAHALGVVHRDLKPENVLIDTEGNGKLTDFGIAVRWGKQAPAAGTPRYLAPELWQGAQASQATDLYAATATCFQCLTGATPFSGGLRQLRAQHVNAAVPAGLIDPPLRDLIARGLAKDPSGRPQSAITFVSELEAVALAAFGPGWEEAGREEVAARAGEVLRLLASGERGTSRSYVPAVGDAGGGRNRGRGVLAGAGVAAVLLAGVAVAVALSGPDVMSMAGASARMPSAAAQPRSGHSPSARSSAVRPGSTPPMTPRAGTPTPTSMTSSSMTPVPMTPAATAGNAMPMVPASTVPTGTSSAAMSFAGSRASGATIVTLGTPVNLDCSVQGSHGPLSWTVTGLPPGLSMTPDNHGATLVISGTPTEAGTFPFTVTVTEGGSGRRSLTGSFVIIVSPQSQGTATTAQPDPTEGTARAS